MIPIGIDGLFSGWKAWAAILIVVAVLGMSFSAGWAVNGWRKDAAHAEVLSEKERQISDMQSKIATQNHAVDILDERSRSAKALRNLAGQYSAGLVNEINKRKAVIENTTATDCDGVLKQGWENAR